MLGFTGKLTPFLLSWFPDELFVLSPSRSLVSD
jgi:hypothetical protein